MILIFNMMSLNFKLSNDKRRNVNVLHVVLIVLILHLYFMIIKLYVTSLRIYRYSVFYNVVIGKYGTQSKRMCFRYLRLNTLSDTCNFRKIEGRFCKNAL